MRLIFCIIIFCSLLVSSAPIPATQNSKIAIIGGGASGVSAGFLLKQYGYKSVTIYEGKNELGGFALTLNIQGNAYDLATMFIPDASILGPGIPPVLKKMVDFSGLQLIEAEDFQTLHLPERKLSRFPEILEKYPAELLKVQLVEGFKEMTKLLQCSANGVDCIKCGVCKDLTETTIQFGIRKNLTAFAELLTYTGDGLGVGPAAFGWIGGSLVSHFWWTPLEIYRCLKFLGVTAKTLPPDVPPALKAMFLANNGTGSKHWWHFKDGYQTFWKVLAERAKISTRLSQQVLSVARSLDGKKWVVTTSKGKEDYDFVISTAAPQDAIKYLPNGQQKTLLEGATPQVPPNDMYLATVNDYPKTLPGTVAFWPEGLGVGTHKLRIDGTPFFWQKRHGSPIILAGTYTGPNQTPEQVWEVVKQWTSANLGFHLDKLLRSYRIVFPSGPHADIRPQWYQTWPTLQGDNGLFVFGEPMCGSGVPVITQCLSSVLPRYFPNQVKYLKDDQDSSPSTSWLSFVVGLPTGIAIAALVTLFIYKTRSRRTEEISTNLLL